MNRRESLRTLVTVSGALISLPAWAQEWTKQTVSGAALLSQTQQDTLVSVVDTIIPAGNSIGAISVGVDKFLEKLLADCYDADVQASVKHNLEKLGQTAVSVHGKPFNACDQKQREELLLNLSTSGIKEENDFFTLIKSETIRGFSTSREVMMNYLSYKPVPGHYYGCVDVKA